MQSSNIFYLFFLKINPYINVYYIKFIKKKILIHKFWNFSKFLHEILNFLTCLDCLHCVWMGKSEKSKEIKLICITIEHSGLRACIYLKVLLLWPLKMINMAFYECRTKRLSTTKPLDCNMKLSINNSSKFCEEGPKSKVTFLGNVSS